MTCCWQLSHPHAWFISSECAYVVKQAMFSAGDLDRIVISPGPGHPRTDSGISREIITWGMGRLPILGVCMGLECLVDALGGEVSPDSPGHRFMTDRLCRRDQTWQDIARPTRFPRHLPWPPHTPLQHTISFPLRTIPFSSPYITSFRDDQRVRRDHGGAPSDGLRGVCAVSPGELYE